MIEKFFSSKGEKIPSKITTFFRSHVDEIEIGHEARLREVCIHYINSDSLKEEFKLGFEKVLLTMDDWWQDLLSESKSKTYENSITYHKEKIFS